MTPALRQLTAEQLRTLRHMLGIDNPYVKAPEPYRDYYCANRDDPNMHELARIGAVAARNDPYAYTSEGLTPLWTSRADREKK